MTLSRTYLCHQQGERSILAEYDIDEREKIRRQSGCGCTVRDRHEYRHRRARKRAGRNCHVITARAGFCYRDARRAEEKGARVIGDRANTRRCRR